MRFTAPRYCDQAFPAYRFIPGKFPHPTANPDGHSYHPPDSPPPAVVFRPPEQWRDSEDYLYGCDLYNHAYWWEAHEAWEGLWQLTDKKGAQGRLLQGLIQVSACHLKLHVGHLRGVQRLRHSSVAHLSAARGQLLPAARTYMGLALDEWITGVQSYYDRILQGCGDRPEHDPQQYPYVILDFGND